MSFFKRRRYFINPNFQGKMIIISLMMTVPIVVLFSAVYSHFMNILLQRAEVLDPLFAESFIRFIAEFERELKFQVIAGTLIILVFNAIFFLFLSHAIAGPIEKLKAHLLKKAEKQKTGPFKIRATDFFPELQDVVNTVFKEEDNQGPSEGDRSPTGTSAQ